VQRWEKTLGDLTSIEKSFSTIGGGSLPDQTLPSWVLVIDCKGFAGGADELASRLRQLNPAVIGRIEDGRVLIDSRTVLPGQDDQLVNGVIKVLN
jgi:L-seryl-tRNA(Ser) seleniumtransferase